MKEKDISVLKILCVYCNAPWDAKMTQDLETSSGCETCGYGGGVRGTIDVYCSNCERLVYRKEIRK